MSAWETNVRRVTPYTPGDQPDRPKMIKLNTNENPYPPAPGVEKALKEFQTDRLRLYPDPAASMLVNALAERYHVKKEQVFVGVGSDDLLAMAFLTAKSPSCFRISPIPFIRSGQKNFGYHMRRCLWTRSLGW